MGVSGLSRPLAAPLSFGHLLTGFVAGVALQLQQAALWPAAGYGALATLAIAVVSVVYGLSLFRRGRSPAARAVRLTVWVLAALLGFGLTGWRAGVFQSSALDRALEGRDVVVTGTVLAMPQINEDAVRFRLRVDSASLDAQVVRLPPQIMLGWYSGFAGRETKNSSAEYSDASELALELQRKPQRLRAGERWQMTVRLKAPHGNSNPYGFDYELWLWEQGIQATGYVRAGPNDTPPLKLSSDWQYGRFSVERARQSVREAIYERVENRQLAGVLAALVVGDQNAIERADHRSGPFDEHLGIAHHHVCLGGVTAAHQSLAALGRLVATLVPGAAREQRRCAGGLVAGSVVRTFFGLGRTGTTHYLDAGHGGTAAPKWPAVALATDLVAGHGRGGGTGPMGFDAGRILAFICRRRRAFCD